MRVQYLRPDEVEKDFRKQANAIHKSLSSKEWNRRVIGRAMVVNVVTGFLRQEDPNGKKWKSSAKQTKFGGKFALKYNKRPSGSPVTSSSLRLNDTSDFMASYDVVWASRHDVAVGPIGSRNRRIAEAAERKWKNPIVGWGPRGKRMLKQIVSTAIDYIAQGKKPPMIGYTRGPII